MAIVICLFKDAFVEVGWEEISELASRVSSHTELASSVGVQLKSPIARNGRLKMDFRMPLCLRVELCSAYCAIS
jgi:hypothetical protein